MTEDSLLPFDLPAVQRKKVTSDFEGGSISSDGGLVLLREAERRLGLAETLASCIRDWRDPARAVHTLPAMLRFRMFAIACGYEDADDCDALRGDPLFKLAVGRAPESGRDLCSQPTMNRLENAPSRIEVARTTAALVDIFCGSFDAPPAAVTLDIDDTCDRVHGHQQLSLFHAHYDTRCFLPVHVYHTDSGRPVAVHPYTQDSVDWADVAKKENALCARIHTLRAWRTSAGCACAWNPIAGHLPCAHCTHRRRRTLPQADEADSVRLRSPRLANLPAGRSCGSTRVNAGIRSVGGWESDQM